MSVQMFTVGPFASNCYLYIDDQTKDAVLIDAGGDDDALIDAITQSEVNLRALLLTHGHGDHIAAVAAVKEAFGMPVIIHAADKNMLEKPSELVSMYYGRTVTAPPADQFFTDEEVSTWGSIEFRIMFTPGHTPGGVCLLDERAGILFSGDTLFAGSIGRTDLPGGDFDLLLESIQTKLLKLPDEIVVYSGHGQRTTIGAERASNPFLTGGYLV